MDTGRWWILLVWTWIDGKLGARAPACQRESEGGRAAKSQSQVRDYGTHIQKIIATTPNAAAAIAKPENRRRLM